MLRSFKIALVALVAPFLLIGGQTLAAAEGQIEGGNIYLIKNVTKSTNFVNPATADPGDTLTYRVRIHNPGPGSLSNVMVKATLDSAVSMSHSSTVTVSSVNANPASTSASATLNLSSAQSIGYVAGSTQLLDSNANVIQNLPDGLVASGINIGEVGVSVNNRRYVQFQVKVGSPTTPSTPVTPATAPLATAGPEDAAAGLLSLSGLGIGTYALRRSRQKLSETLLKK